MRPLLDLSLLGKMHTLLEWLNFLCLSSSSSRKEQHTSLTYFPHRAVSEAELSTSTFESACTLPINCIGAIFMNQDSACSKHGKGSYLGFQGAPGKAPEIRQDVVCVKDLFSLGPTGFPLRAQREGKNRPQKQRTL